MKQKLVTLASPLSAILVILALSVLVFTSHNPTITGRATDDKPSGPPTFTNVRTTFYFIPESDDYIDWCTDCTPNLGGTAACIIGNKGFYEEVVCQGSGIHNGQVYNYSSIAPTPEDSVASGQHPLTRTGTVPEPKRTIAVNNRQGSACYIPYGSDVYIDLGEDNEWTGWYKAEDTGSMMRGRCKIDIFIGTGNYRTNLRDAARQADRDGVKIWVYDKGHPIPRGVALDGEFLGKYVYTPYLKTTTTYDYTVYDRLQTFAEDALTCNDNVAVCLEEKITTYNTDNPEPLSAHCADIEQPYYEMIEQLFDCATTSMEECKCKITSNAATNHLIHFEELDGIIVVTKPPLPPAEDAPGESFDLPFKLGIRDTDTIWVADDTILEIILQGTDYIVTTTNPRRELTNPTLFRTADGLLFMETPPYSHYCLRQKTHYPLRVSLPDNYTLPTLIVDKGKTAVENKVIPIRFALTLTDTTPPPTLTGVTATRKEPAVIITWPKSTAEDVQFYNVQLSDGLGETVAEQLWDVLFEEPELAYVPTDVTCTATTCVETDPLGAIVETYSYDTYYFDEATNTYFVFALGVPDPGTVVVFVQDEFGNEAELLNVGENFVSVV